MGFERADKNPWKQNPSSGALTSSWHQILTAEGLGHIQFAMPTNNPVLPHNTQTWRFCKYAFLALSRVDIFILCKHSLITDSYWQNFCLFD